MRDSLIEFDNDYPKPEGEIERLNVPDKDEEGFEALENLKTLLTPSAIKMLVYRLLKDKRNKVILRCKGSELLDRFTISVYLTLLCGIDYEIRPISLTTKRPRDKYCNLFDVAVTQKTFSPPRHADKWSYINWDHGEFKKGKPKAEQLKKVFQKIESDFKHDIDTYID